MQSGLDLRLEALERMKLRSELILFGDKKNSPEDFHAVAIDIASTFNIEVSPSDIVACFCIPASNGRLRSLVVRLSSYDIRNR